MRSQGDSDDDDDEAEGERKMVVIEQANQEGLSLSKGGG